MSAVSTATISLPSPELADTLAPAPALPDDGSTRLPRNPFPVGARFPRRSAAGGDAYRPPYATAPAAVAVFPVGARLRHAQSDILAYLADVELGRRTPARRSHPVGARFPRRPR